MRNAGPFVFFAVLLGLDQWLKVWTVNHWAAQGWPPNSQTITVIPGFMDFYLTYNTGAAWSLFSGAALPLAVLRLAVGVAIVYYIWRVLTGRSSGASPRYRTAFVYILALIAAGAVGNAIDGIYQGKVTDMFSSHWLNAVYGRITGQGFPIFNIADSCVVGGVIFLLILSLLDRKKPEQSKQSAPEGQPRA